MTLEDRFVEGATFPRPFDTGRLLELEKYRALFDNDRGQIYAWVHSLRIAGRAEGEAISNVAPLREFVAYPSPRIAARTLAAFLFGEDAQISIESSALEAELADLIDENHLHALNFESAVASAAFGETYYKLDWDDEVSSRAIISSIPPDRCFPLFRFRRLSEIAFVRTLEHSERDKRKVLRHVEIRVRGFILNRLFLGSPTKLGVEWELERHPDTADLPEQLETGIDDVLVRHAPFFRIAGDPHGISIFNGNEGLIEGIHSLYTQDQHDAEMSKRRVAIPSAYLERTSSGRPKFDRQLDVLELTSEAVGAIGGTATPIQPIEFTDSTAMGDRIAQRLDEFFLACGIAPQSAGRDTAGAAESGTARKLAQSLTIQTVGAAGRYFSPAIRDILRLALVVGAKHLGRPGSAEIPNPNVELMDGIPLDEVETAEIVANASGAAAMSTETKVRRLNPSWTDDKVSAEVKQINEDEGLKIPPGLDLGGDDTGGIIE